MYTFKVILHPTDFSPHSEAAFQLACSLARDHGARLIVLHVIEPPVRVLAGIPALPPTPEEYGREELEARLGQFQAPEGGVVVTHRLVEGEPASSILRVAREVPCDLILMGTHGRRGLARLLMGSVAEKVVRKSPCPVLTVKNPSATPALEVTAKETVGV